MIQRPNPNEYDPYFEVYISKVDDKGCLHVLESTDFLHFMSEWTEAQWALSYAPGKWNLREVLVHLMDTERIFAYRALRIARGDKTALAGFEQDGYVTNSAAALRSTSSLIQEYKTVRAATLSLFTSLDEEMILRGGTASGAAISVRALAYMIAGHELHHKQIIIEKYL